MSLFWFPFFCLVVAVMGSRSTGTSFECQTFMGTASRSLIPPHTSTNTYVAAPVTIAYTTREESTITEQIRNRTAIVLAWANSTVATTVTGKTFTTTSTSYVTHIVNVTDFKHAIVESTMQVTNAVVVTVPTPAGFRYILTSSSSSSTDASSSTQTTFTSSSSHTMATTSTTSAGGGLADLLHWVNPFDHGHPSKGSHSSSPAVSTISGSNTASASTTGSIVSTSNNTATSSITATGSSATVSSSITDSLAISTVSSLTSTSAGFAASTSSTRSEVVSSLTTPTTIGSTGTLRGSFNFAYEPLSSTTTSLSSSSGRSMSSSLSVSGTTTLSTPSLPSSSLSGTISQIVSSTISTSTRTGAPLITRDASPGIMGLRGAIMDNPHLSRPLYETEVNCTKNIWRYSTIWEIEVAPPRTTTVALTTSTHTTTNTSTSYVTTPATRVDETVSSFTTSTVTSTSTHVEHGTSTSYRIFTVSETHTSYMACATPNFAGPELASGEWIINLYNRGNESYTMYDIGAASSAKDCCVECMTNSVACMGSVFVDDTCMLLNDKSGTCLGADTPAGFYKTRPVDDHKYSHVELPEFVISNGPCGYFYDDGVGV